METLISRRGGMTVEVFRAETDQTDRSLVVRLIGAFDYLAFEQVDTLLTDAQLGGKRTVVVDLRGLTSIDSTGIKALLHAHLRASVLVGHFRLIRGPEHVQRVFELIGVDKRFDFVDPDQP
jgi:anti-anti-sigma factor